jgi:hypothetical protein
MPRHQPSEREPGAPGPDGVVKMQLDKDGKPVPVFRRAPVKATTEAKPKPREAEDPRHGPMRDVPPWGGGAG